MGYVLGKTEGKDRLWHGHVTALSVAPAYRLLGLGKGLMRLLEKASEVQEAWFVDLYVRVSNEKAVKMYEGMGYSVYRTVVGYYQGGTQSGDEDGYGELLPFLL